MFASLGQGVVFMEIVLDLKKQRHTFLECIPLEKQLAKQAPLYFKV